MNIWRKDHCRRKEIQCRKGHYHHKQICSITLICELASLSRRNAKCHPKMVIAGVMIGRVWSLGSQATVVQSHKSTHIIRERESLFCSRLLTWRRAWWSSYHVWCGWRSECCASRWAIVSSWTWRNCIRRSRRKRRRSRRRRSRRRRSRWSEVCIPCCCSTWRLDPRSRKLRSSSREPRRRRSCYRALKRWSSKPRRSNKLLRWSSSCTTSWWILHSLLIGLLLHRRRGRGIIRCLRSSRGWWPLPLSPHACDKWRESVSKAGYSTPMCFLAKMCYFSSCCRWWSWHTGVWKTFTH